MHKGIYYKLDVYDKRGQPVLPQNLQEQLKWIVEDANKHQGIEYLLTVINYTESSEWYFKIMFCGDFVLTHINRCLYFCIQDDIFLQLFIKMTLNVTFWWYLKIRYQLSGNGRFLLTDENSSPRKCFCIGLFVFCIVFYFWIKWTFCWCLGDYSEGAKSLASLTGLGRTEWAQIRNKYFSSGLNKDSLDTLEQALFHVRFQYTKPIFLQTTYCKNCLILLMMHVQTIAASRSQCWKENKKKEKENKRKEKKK